jgi:hypothetical protein
MTFFFVTPIFRLLRIKYLLAPDIWGFLDPFSALLGTGKKLPLSPSIAAHHDKAQLVQQQKWIPMTIFVVHCPGRLTPTGELPGASHNLSGPLFPPLESSFEEFQ